MAGLVPVAQHILRAPSSAELAARMSWLPERMRVEPHKRPWDLRTTAQASPLLISTLRSLPVRTRSSKLTAGAEVDRSGSESRLTADYVPAFYWPERYASGFAKLLAPMMTERTGRRFCSIALVKSFSSCTWKVATSQLGYPDGNLGYNGMRKVSKSGTLEEFQKVLREEAAALVSEAQPVNWGELRRSLAAFRVISTADWLELCKSAHVHAGRGAKQQNAAAWIWSELTGGDPRLAPGGGRWDKPRCEAFDYFVTVQLPTMRDALLEYGKDLLAAADLSALDSDRPELLRRSA